MEVSGKIKQIDETKTFGSNGFRKRELVLVTNEQYPQSLLIEFVQDKCDLLDSYKAEQEVAIGVNLRGREWVNPEGKTIYFNSIQGWKIDSKGAANTTPNQADLPPIENLNTETSDSSGEEPDDLPF